MMVWEGNEKQTVGAYFKVSQHFSAEREGKK
jgi:hypothetical protein